MKRFSKFLAILLAVAMILPGMAGIVEASEAKINSGKEYRTVISLNLRSKSNDRAAPVIYVPRGETVVHSEGEIKNDYFKLEYKGKKGYAHRSDVTAYYGTGEPASIDLKKKANNKTYKVVKDDVLRSRDLKRAFPTAIVSGGQVVTHKGTTGNDWFLVETKDGKKGYIYRGDVTTPNNYDKGGKYTDVGVTVDKNVTETLVVIRDDVLRSKDISNAGTTAILTRGDRVTYKGTTNKDWFLVENGNGKKGYIYRGYVTAQQNFKDDDGDKEDLEPETSEAKEQLQKNLKFIYETVENPSFGTGAGEWSILSLARGGYDVPEEYYNLYHENVENKVKELMKDGKLHRAKSTEHSRLILGFTAIGMDITDVAGYDIREALADFNYSTRQGINGPIFALIALDSNDYEIPIIEGIEKQSTREMFIDFILGREIKQESGEIGGWALGGNTPDPDITAMAIQGLTPYYETKDVVKAAVDRGIDWLSKAQKEDGGYASWGSENIESASQVVVALTGLGIDPHNDPRFVKNGNSVIDNLLTFAVETGGFMHVKPGGDTGGGAAAGIVDGMATDQGTYALVAYDRFVNSQNSLYDMRDVKVGQNP